MKHLPNRKEIAKLIAKDKNKSFDILSNYEQLHFLKEADKLINILKKWLKNK